MHERQRSPYRSPSRSPWRSNKCPNERKLHTAGQGVWPRKSTVLGWSDPTFGHDSVPKVNRGSLQPNKKIPSVRALRIWAKQVQKEGITYCRFVFTNFCTL